MVRVVRIVGVIAAKDAEGSVGATVEAVRGLDEVDDVLVVDDGSVDATAAEARAAGATVLRLPNNVGKGAAVLAGVQACPDADVFLLIDADVGATAAAADRLLGPLLADEADLVVGVLPSGATGGLGTVRRLAAAGIQRAGGGRLRAPLSGQRAVRAPLLRDLAGVERFGLEVGMTIDAVRDGARLLEVEVAMSHRRTGRSLAGFLHRGRQGRDIVRSLWPRLTSARARVNGLVVVSSILVAGLLWSGSSQIDASTPPREGVERVVLVGVPHLALDDLGRGTMPTLDSLALTGAAAATNVRTLSPHPASSEAYASLGAGARVATAPVYGSLAFPLADGRIGVPFMPTARRSPGRYVSSRPGALGQALHDAGLTTAVVGNADTAGTGGEPASYRPAALAVADNAGIVSGGIVEPDDLVVADPAEPYGVKADVGRYVSATRHALRQADLVVVDLGDMNRAAWQAHDPARVGTPAEDAATRRRALRRVDDYLARLVPELDRSTLLLVVGVRPPIGQWELTPTVAYGAGVLPGGSLYSPATKRRNLVTLTDIAPTILSALHIEVPTGMVGSPLRYRHTPFDLPGSTHLNDLAASRERVYKPMALTFILAQVGFYADALLCLGRRGGRRWLRFGVLVFAAWPLATFAERGVPGIERFGAWRQLIVWILAAVITAIASRARRHPLAPLSWIAGATVATLIVDVASGARLQMASVLGYSPHTAGRYVGFGNTAFAVLAACAAILAATHVAYAPRQREAVVTAGALLSLVLIADVWPTLGADVGGILTMVPVFGLLLLALAGRRLSWRTIGLAGAATAVVLAAITALDLTRPPASRTHLGRFVASGDLATTIQRKWAMNMHLFGHTLWTWMVPLTVAVVVYLLVVNRGWQRLLPQGSPLRAGAIATVAAGLLGWLVNDSGVVVAALVFVFVGPYLVLLTLDERRELLPPI